MHPVSVRRADAVGVGKTDVIGITKINTITVKIVIVEVSSIDGLNCHVGKAAHCSSNTSRMVQMP